MQSDVITVEIDGATGSPAIVGRAPLPAFIMNFQEFLVDCADRPLTGGARRLLDYIMGTMRLSNGNYCVAINQQELAVRWKTSQGAISRAVKELKKRNLLLKGHRAGKGTVYRLNPHWAWKDKGEDHAAACIAAPKPIFGKISSLDEKRKRKSA